MKFKSFAFVGVLAVSLFIASCATPPKKKVESNSPDATQVSSVDNGKNQGLGLEANGDSDSNKAGALKSIYFEFNSAGLSSETKQTLNNNAQYLKTNGKIKIQVEGHCDERGGVQFNLALGEKRAKGVRDYLAAQGVEASRMTTISFGKERPVAFGHDETAWGQNRRANFLITSK
jgi:peptidoglycan-associated lipoprotein